MLNQIFRWRAGLWQTGFSGNRTCHSTQSNSMSSGACRAQHMVVVLREPRRKLCAWLKEGSCVAGCTHLMCTAMRTSRSSYSCTVRTAEHSAIGILRPDPQPYSDRDHAAVSRSISSATLCANPLSLTRSWCLLRSGPVPAVAAAALAQLRGDGAFQRAVRPGVLVLPLHHVPGLQRAALPQRHRGAFPLFCLAALLCASSPDALCANERFMCTQLFLYPIGAIAVVVPICVLLGFNPTRFTLSIYF